MVILCRRQQWLLSSMVKLNNDAMEILQRVDCWIVTLHCVIFRNIATQYGGDNRMRQRTVHEDMEILMGWKDHAEDVRSWSHRLLHELALRSRSTRATRSNERRGQLDDMPPSYVGDPGFKSWPADRPSQQILCGVLQFLQAIFRVFRHYSAW